ncbi:DNA polymerase delta catalytic subunit-like [Magnolia sinica]|uniref:DNA polymerase delta catalytic subunit-like n=1 Tax=Magnolia sinica TaxID=86752 RepID=UPI00265A8367|nr:DNA polymerase delta catalytic subunit-like [Magnolia sinica]
MISNQYLFKQIGCHSYLCSYSKMHFYFILLHALIFCLCGCHEKRDAATAPNVGDRVPYVIIKAAKGAKAYERSEDPIFVLENNIPIDSHYYLENQISKPLLRIFDPILKNAEKELLHGSHTRSVSISTPSNSGIMKFAKKQLCCIGCKALIR